MNLKNQIGKIIALLILSTSLNGCLSVAKLSDFPKTSTAIDFNKYSVDFHEQKKAFWTTETSNEYYFERIKVMTGKNVNDIIQNALRQKGYKIIGIDLENDYVIGKRGIHANEWKSITGVYYKLDNDKQMLQIYITTKITQDFEGGWRENRAKKVGQIIEKVIDSNN